MKTVRLVLAVALAAAIMLGCGGQTTAADQASKRMTLDKVASKSPNADKVEH
jgi:ABC-type glycerol-3-phosphate transport system substrate-binding protein